MTTTSESSTRRGRFFLYGLIAVLGVVLVTIAVATWRTAKSNQQAQTKADQLIAALNVAGARTPAREQIIRVFADDGGAVCASPNDALRKAALLAGLSNGAGGPGSRPVIADTRFVRAETLVISIYCPSELPEFQQFVADLETVSE
jgi:Tfp pilus assembly protein FimT